MGLLEHLVSTAFAPRFTGPSTRLVFRGTASQAKENVEPSVLNRTLTQHE